MAITEWSWQTSNGTASVIPLLKENILSSIDGGIEDRISRIDAEIRDKQKQLLGAGNDTERTSVIGDEILSLREERQNVMTEAALNREVTECCASKSWREPGPEKRWQRACMTRHSPTGLARPPKSETTQGKTAPACIFSCSGLMQLIIES